MMTLKLFYVLIVIKWMKKKKLYMQYEPNLHDTTLEQKLEDQRKKK